MFRSQEELIHFVVQNLFQVKSKRETLPRVLSHDEIAFFQNGIIDRERHPGNFFNSRNEPFFHIEDIFSGIDKIFF